MLVFVITISLVLIARWLISILAAAMDRIYPSVAKESVPLKEKPTEIPTPICTSLRINPPILTPIITTQSL